MSQYQIISIYQRTINIINCAQEGVSLISKQGEVKKKNCYLFQHQGHTNKMDSWIQSILKTMFEFVLTQVTYTEA